MLDATDLKGHPTASSLKRGICTPLDRWNQGGMTSGAPCGLRQSRWPRRMYLSEAKCSDFTGADVVLKDLPPAAAVLGDKGYDSDKIRRMLAEQGTLPCIPPRRNHNRAIHLQQEAVENGSQN